MNFDIEQFDPIMGISMMFDKQNHKMQLNQGELLCYLIICKMIDSLFNIRVNFVLIKINKSKNV